MLLNRVWISLAMALAVLVLFAPPACAGDEWQPISPEELRMTSEPLAPGAPAIILYLQVDRNDAGGNETRYVRIKILTEEGRKYADVEIPYSKDAERISALKARVIRPDGTSADFSGQVYDKTIVKARGVQVSAKTLTLPGVQVGGIIEYRYSREWNSYWLYDSRWILSQGLFTRRASFSLWPSKQFTLRWTWRDIPNDAEPQYGSDGFIHLNVAAIPAFQAEDYMPPEPELQARVDFVYSSNPYMEQTKFWDEEAKRFSRRVENFLSRNRGIPQAVRRITSPGDPPEEGLRKLYARSQQVRNLSFETRKTGQEEHREKLKPINSVEDVWARGFGTGAEITWLFLALARAAGFEANPVMVATRDEYFFRPRKMNSRQLNTNVVLVKLNGKDFYLDPGSAYSPFGMLPWFEAGAPGLLLTKDGGSWVQTTLPDSSQSRVDRKAVLKLTGDGALEGTLTVTYSGLQALGRRLEERADDAAGRKKFLEDEVKESLPAGSTVELKNLPEWNSSSPTLAAEYALTVRNWVTPAGRKAFIPAAVFGGVERHVFEPATRVHPIYFRYPSARSDDVTIELPAGWQAVSFPAPKTQEAAGFKFSLQANDDHGRLHLARSLSIDKIEWETEQYDVVRTFFAGVRTADEQQIILQPGPPDSAAR
jgi:hypothetical protein